MLVLISHLIECLFFYSLNKKNPIDYDWDIKLEKKYFFHSELAFEDGIVNRDFFIVIKY